MDMSNPFKIHFDCLINIPEIFMQFDDTEPFSMKNHSVRDMDLEPGHHSLYVGYRMVVGDKGVDFTDRLDVVIDRGFDYNAKICNILKTFTFLKIYGSDDGSCC